MKDKLLLIAGCLLLLVGCEKTAEKPLSVSNSSFEVEQLFTDSKGYTVNRFRDAGHAVYYVTGPKDSSINYVTPEGKTTRNVTINTVK